MEFKNILDNIIVKAFTITCIGVFVVASNEIDSYLTSVMQLAYVPKLTQTFCTHICAP
jgi:hypothetical protein